jgi:cathepsin B
MRIAIFLVLIALVFGRRLIPMDDAMEQRLRSLGYEPDSSWMQATYDDEVEGVEPPVEFDCREKWPTCINNVTDEGKCLGSWAITVSDVVSDRACIKSAGKVKAKLSPQYLISCDKSDSGCRGGGNGQKAFEYILRDGIPTDECVPWTSGNTGDNGTCNPGVCTGKGIFQPRRCLRTIFAVSETDIKRELMTEGSLYCRFDMHVDFNDYKSGIYYMVNPELVEKDHAVRLLGWGNENTIHYWSLVNSWSSKWGENGFFRMKIGESNVCSIAIGCDPDTN